MADKPIVAAQFFDLFINSFFSDVLGHRDECEKVTIGFYA